MIKLNNSKNKQSIKALAIMIAAMFILTACGSSGNSSYGDSIESATNQFNQSGVSNSTNDYNSIQGGDFGISSDSVTVDKSSAESTESGSSETLNDGETTTQPDGTIIKIASDKLVYRCSIEIETKNYDEDLASLMKLIDEYDGIIQNSNESDDDNYWYQSDYVKQHGTKSIRLQIRVPQAKYHEFVGTIGTVGKVRQNSQSVDNISYEYYNTQADIEQLKIQESRLLDMMEQAQTIDEMITVEDRLTEVQNELSKMQTKLIGLDTDVAYSYVDISLEEVYQYTDTPVEKPGFLQRLGEEIVQAFKDMIFTFEELIIFILCAIPRLVPFALIAFIVYKAIRRYRRNHKPKGPKGPRGPRGPQGPRGPRGPQGPGWSREYGYEQPLYGYGADGYSQGPENVNSEQEFESQKSWEPDHTTGQNKTVERQKPSDNDVQNTGDEQKV